jgi:hypothetical protein
MLSRRLSPTKSQETLTTGHTCFVDATTRRWRLARLTLQTIVPRERFEERGERSAVIAFEIAWSRDQSVLSARSGSTRSARQAGSTQAIRAIPKRMSGATTKVRGSRVEMP